MLKTTLTIAACIGLLLGLAPTAAADPLPVGPDKVCFATLQACVDVSDPGEPSDLERTIRDLLGPCTCDPID